jgi:hypothetical protein
MVPKLMYFVPMPPIEPADAPVPSSSVLIDVAPTVLPPSTVPVNDAPGSISTRLVKPAARVTAVPAALLPLMNPALITVPGPPPIDTAFEPVIVPPGPVPRLSWLMTVPPAPSPTPSLPPLTVPAFMNVPVAPLIATA